jgi:hypothetical protein
MSLALIRRSCRVCQFMVFNISDTLLVLWCLLHVYLAARHCTFSRSLCEDPKQCSSILILVLLGFDMLVLLLFVIVLLDFFWYSIMICLLWWQFVECGCSILGLLKLWHLDSLRVEQITLGLGLGLVLLITIHYIRFFLSSWSFPLIQSQK